MSTFIPVIETMTVTQAVARFNLGDISTIRYALRRGGVWVESDVTVLLVAETNHTVVSYLWNRPNGRAIMAQYLGFSVLRT